VTTRLAIDPPALGARPAARSTSAVAARAAAHRRGRRRPERASRAGRLALPRLPRALERLSPVERAAFLLREVFAYPYDEIAAVIGKSEANARQLVTRARRHVDAERPRFEVDREAHEELTDRFLEATQNGDTEGLIELLAEDVYTYTDGGGKAQAPRRTVHGRDHVARFMVGIARPDRGITPVTLHPVLVNGVPGRVARDAHGHAVAVLTLDVSDGLVTVVRIVANPDKLAHLHAS
jgi:RNA polymerase sigma-70 factor (ECF subfamily)